MDLDIQSWTWASESGLSHPESVLGHTKSGLGSQSLDRPCILAEVTEYSVELGVQSLDIFCTLAEIERNVDRHWTKVGLSLDSGVLSLDLVSNQLSSTNTQFTCKFNAAISPVCTRIFPLTFHLAFEASMSSKFSDDSLIY